VFADALLGEGRRHVDGLHDGAGLGIGPLADVDGAGRKTPVAL
jgi:hypothetical protein